MTGRNDPCPCGSKMKFKKCCGRSKAMLSKRVPSAEAVAHHHAQIAKLQQQERSYGQVRPIIHADYQGQRFVAVGGKLHWSDKWKTFPDFLFAYIKMVFGKEWWLAECKRAASDRHPIIQWSYHLYESQKKQARGENGLFAIEMDGPISAYMTVAYDLYVLSHHQRLQNEVVRRLKHRDQFQGARYELLVTATLIRAGFDIEFEDETDSTTTHPEFIATHKATGEHIAVEAKSRHRAGVLGRTGEQQAVEELKIGVRRELNRAARKSINCPFVVFVDLNLPVDRLSPSDAAWMEEIRSDITRLGLDVAGRWPFALIVITNYPHHYGRPGEPDPIRLVYVCETGDPVHPIKHRAIVAAIETALHQYKVIPSEFPDDSRIVKVKETGQRDHE